VLARAAPEFRGASFSTDAAVIAAAALFVASPSAPARAAEPKRWTRRELDRFTLPAVDGGSFALDGCAAAAVIVHFFATVSTQARTPAERHAGQAGAAIGGR